jgi:hypothetical protein
MIPSSPGSDTIDQRGQDNRDPGTPDLPSVDGVFDEKVNVAVGRGVGESVDLLGVLVTIDNVGRRSSGQESSCVVEARIGIVNGERSGSNLKMTHFRWCGCRSREYSMKDAERGL